MKTILLTFFVSLTVFAFTQEAQIDFSLLRQNDDLSSINDTIPLNNYQRYKKTELGKNRELSFGGSYRYQMESFVNEQFSTETDQNDYWHLNRFMLHSHLKVSDKFEFFVELNSSLIFSKKELSPVDKDELALNQFFVSYHLTPFWSLSLGRKNMRLGSGRLVDIREGPNVRLSFDLAELNFQKETYNLKFFSAVPVINNEGVFDNDWLDFNEYLIGFYSTFNLKNNSTIDVYSFFKLEEDKEWNKGVENDERVSLGIRHAGKKAGFNYNNESLIQMGKFGSNEIFAWTISFNIEKRVTVKKSNYALGVKTELISGDADENDNRLNTFDALYPRGAYFGRVARFGPSNLIDIHPYIHFNKGNFDLELDYVAFWRFSKDDGIYNPALILQYPSTNKSRFIAHQIGTITTYGLNNFLAIELETNLIFPEDFLVNSGLNDTLFHSVLTAELKF